MAPRKPVEQELTPHMIMNAARDLFVSKGYQHVSMRQIAQKLGYSHGAIYYHFKNKAELFFALVEDHFQLLDRQLDEILKQNLEPEEKLKQIMLGFIRFGLTHQSHYEIMFLIKDKEVINYLNQGPNHTYEKFAQAVYLLTDKKTTIQEIWSVFLSMHGFVSHYLRGVNTYADVKDLAADHVRFLIKALK
ncbi:TetR/AcrR family transcriptional regulator [Sporolactobacillus sp. THM7-7]|nr:TetR/AcrR family transcriptional regulator [Sporolactobacillus sp. THM7-7]